MKIKLALLEQDKNYLNKIVSVFSSKYADKFEIYSFSELPIALKELEASHLEVFIADSAFEIDVSAIPKRCGFAYFVNSSDIETVREQRAICKFQKADLIYKQILSIYSENAGSVSGLKLGDGSTKVIIFSSPNGGVGTSTVAAACATYFASTHKKVLYLNFERFGMSDTFFSAEGNFDMSDIIFSLKSKKTNLAMKLESCVKRAENGVCFYSQTRLALDMLELSTEDMIRLISELKLTGSYDFIVVDMDFSMNKDYLKVYKQAHSFVWVGDGSEISNQKIRRAYDALVILEENADAPLTNRLGLIYNKFSARTGRTVGELEKMRDIGGAPSYGRACNEDIIKTLVLEKREVFEKVL